MTMFQKKGDGPRLDAGGQIDPDVRFEPIDDADNDDDEPPFNTDKPRRHAGGGGGLFEQEATMYVYT